MRIGKSGFGAVLFGLSLLLAACGSQTSGGSGGEGGFTQQQFEQVWQSYSDDLNQAFNDLQSDPAIAAIFGSPIITTTNVKGAASLAFNPGKVLTLAKNARSVFPLTQHELPRGGTDYTTSPPTTYSPTDFYDFGMKWSTNSGQVAELLVDWDKDGTSTLFAEDPYGTSQEVPQKSYAELLLDSNKVGSASLEASWYYCDTTSSYIQEPTNLSFTGSLGQTKTLTWDIGFDLTEGSTDTLEAHIQLGTTGTNPTTSLRYDLTLNGDLSRGSDCFITDFQVQSGSFTATSRVNSDEVVFHVNVTNIAFDASGSVSRIDLNGHIEHNGQRAVSFNGYLDQTDFQASCPGAHVTLTFSDGSTTLQDWLRSHGNCSP